jgi:dihydroorotase-like cyclic amidohydrolase
VALCFANPAKIFGCGQKGAVAVGMDAAIVILISVKTGMKKPCRR